MKEKLPKKPTWAELRRVVVESRDSYGVAIQGYIRSWPSSHRKAAALALSVAHWSPAARGNYDDSGRLKNAPYVELFPAGFASCGLCQLYYAAKDSCRGCPLQRAGEDCRNDRKLTLYTEVLEHRDRAGRTSGFHEAADALYNKLCELYLEELRRLGYDA